MSRLRESVLLVCLLLGLPALAQEKVAETASPAAVDDPSVLAVVMGLSADDLLNIRREASPLGRTLGRLPNGALVNRRECRMVKRYEWCLVETIDGDRLSGWTPARYLFVQSDNETRTGATAASGETAETAEAAAAAPGIPVPMPAPRQPKPEAVASTEAGAPEPALPPGLEARFAGGPAEPAATSAKPEPELLALASEPAAPQREARAVQPPPAAAEPAIAPGIPVPTPRPDSAAGAAAPPPAAPEADGEPVALAAVAVAPAGIEGETVPVEQPGAILPDTGTDAEATETGETVSVEQADEPDKSARIEMVAAAIPAAADPAPVHTVEVPCARYVGQPMGRCPMNVARGGRDMADVTIVWPDGGSRTIAFRNGEPASANTRGELRVTREGTLNMIRIGAAERFEILDDLVFDE